MNFSRRFFRIKILKALNRSYCVKTVIIKARVLG